MARDKLAAARDSNPAFADAKIHDGTCVAGGFEERVMHKELSIQGHSVHISVWL